MVRFSHFTPLCSFERLVKLTLVDVHWETDIRALLDMPRVEINDPNAPVSVVLSDVVAVETSDGSLTISQIPNFCLVLHFSHSKALVCQDITRRELGILSVQLHVTIHIAKQRIKSPMFSHLTLSKEIPSEIG